MNYGRLKARWERYAARIRNWVTDERMTASCSEIAEVVGLRSDAVRYWARDDGAPHTRTAKGQIILDVPGLLDWIYEKIAALKDAA